MARDPLNVLIGLRRRSCDEAERVLVRCIAAETQADRLTTDAERAIARETELASDPSGTDSMVEAFATWLPGARRRLEEARRNLESLQAETARGRAELTVCRAALESVETLQRERQHAARVAQEKRQQSELDDIVGGKAARGEQQEPGSL